MLSLIFLAVKSLKNYRVIKLTTLEKCWNITLNYNLIEIMKVFTSSKSLITISIPQTKQDTLKIKLKKKQFQTYQVSIISILQNPFKIQKE